jgi:hypothetical protein
MKCYVKYCTETPETVMILGCLAYHISDHPYCREHADKIASSETIACDYCDLFVDSIIETPWEPIYALRYAPPDY